MSFFCSRSLENTTCDSLILLSFLILDNYKWFSTDILQNRTMRFNSSVLSTIYTSNTSVWNNITAGLETLIIFSYNIVFGRYSLRIIFRFIELRGNIQNIFHIILSNWTIDLKINRNLFEHIFNVATREQRDKPSSLTIEPCTTVDHSKLIYANIFFLTIYKTLYRWISRPLIARQFQIQQQREAKCHDILCWYHLNVKLMKCNSILGFSKNISFKEN